MFYKTGESYTFSQICFCPYFIKERIVAMRKFIFSGLDFCDPKQLFVFLNRQGDPVGIFLWPDNRNCSGPSRNLLFAGLYG